MSFGESMFSTGFNQKTIKGDIFVKGNHEIPPRDQRGKVPEDSRRLSTEAGHMSLTCGAAWPLVGPPVNHIAMSFLHRLLGCILAIISSRFDPRAED